MMPYAVVEVMGHRLYAGQFEEVTLAGVQLLRVVVPEVEVERLEYDYNDRGRRDRIRTVAVRYPAHEVMLGGGAIFQVAPCTEATARSMVPSAYRPDGTEPILTPGEWRPYEPAAALPGPVEEAVVVYDDEDEDDDATVRESPF